MAGGASFPRHTTTPGPTTRLIDTLPGQAAATAVRELRAWQFGNSTTVDAVESDRGLPTRAPVHERWNPMSIDAPFQESVRRPPVAGDLSLGIRPAGEEDRTTLESLVQFYLYDLSQAGDWDVDDTGRFENRPIQGLWMDRHRQPFILSASHKIAGFAIVTVDEAGTGFDMTEFFILRKWRRSGVGTRCARTLITDRPGTWTIKPFAPYPPAEAFWCALVSTLAQDGRLSGSEMLPRENGGTVIRLIVGDVARGPLS